MQERPESRHGTTAPPAPSPEVAAALQQLGREALGAPVAAIEPMAGGGSDRTYFRLRTEGATAVAALCTEAQTYRTFLGLTAHLAPKGIPVPRLLATDDGRQIYVQEDLGRETLADRIARWEARGEGEAALGALETMVRWLPAIQLRGAEGLADRLIAGNPGLDAAGYRADLETFLAHYVAGFVPAVHPEPPARAALEAMAERLGALPREHFCYRDFQTRNVMWRDGGPVFLDYQSATRGPGAYDLASILYSPDSRLDEPGRERLIAAYLDELARLGQPAERASFLADFYRIVLLRRLQALGAYARIAHDKGEGRYLTRVAPALAALDTLLGAGRFADEPPPLCDWLARLVAHRPSA